MSERKIKVVTHDNAYMHYDELGNVIRAAYTINADGHELFSEEKTIDGGRENTTKRTYLDRIETTIETRIGDLIATTITIETLDKDGIPTSFRSIATYDSKSSPYIEKEITDYNVKYERLEKGYRKRFVAKAATNINPTIYGFELRDDGRVEVTYRATELLTPMGGKIRQLAGWIQKRKDRNSPIIRREEFISGQNEDGFEISIGDVLKKKAGLIVCTEKLEYNGNGKLTKLTRIGHFTGEEIENYTYIDNE